MSRNLPFLILASLIVTSCSTNKKAAYNQSANQIFDVSLDTLSLFDQSRNRDVPIAIFKSKRHSNNNSQRIVIFSHGYGENRPGSYLAYSYLTNFLASIGYFVVSIQHELPTDSLIPLAGKPQIVRRPFWDRGADNVFFVINQLKKLNPQLDFNRISLV
jgi:predicted dienelactone hydrolase